MTSWIVWLAKLKLRKCIMGLMRMLVATSAFMLIIQHAFIEQINHHQKTIQAQKKYFLYHYGDVSRLNDTLPEYARRLSNRDDPDVSPQAAVYKMFGKTTVVAKFKSSFPKYHIKKMNNQNIRIFKHPQVFDTTFNGNITVHHINKYAYLRSSAKYLYILSAFARYKSSNKTNKKGKTKYSLTSDDTADPETFHKSSKAHNDDVILVGWIQELATNTSILCCFLRDDFSVISYPNMKRLIWTQVKKQELIAGKVFCPIPPDINTQEVLGAALSMTSEKCRKETFIHIESAQILNGNSVGVCSKIIYGSLQADRLVEWLEIQRFIEVDKVLLYVYNLDETTVNVIKHYTLSGFVEMVPFDYPMAAELTRHVGQKEALAYIDEQVVVFDCMERLRGYTYVTIMDVDEILHAKGARNHSLKVLMKKLQNFYPDAGGFTFKTELFITDWPTSNQSDSGIFWHSKHQNRTRPLIDRPKNMLITDRTVLGSIWTHNYTLKAGYDRYMVPVNLAIIKHYRPCRKNWGCENRSGYIDKSIVKIALGIKDKIYEQFDLLNITRRSTQ